MSDSILHAKTLVSLHVSIRALVSFDLIIKMDEIRVIKLVIGFNLIISTISCWISTFIIQRYIQSKPLGRQTLLDKFLIQFLHSYRLMVTVTNFLFFFMAVPAPALPQKLAQIGFYCANFALNYWLIWLSSVVWVKYLTIFHRSLLETLKSDAEVICIGQILNWSLFLVLYCLEHFYIGDFNYSAFYQFLYDKETTPDGSRSIPKTSIFLVVLAVISIFVLHFRLEKSGFKQNHQENATQEKTKVNKFFRRLVFLVVGGTLCYISYALATVPLSNRISRILNGFFCPIFTSIIPPILFILGNPNLKEFAMKRLKNVINS